VIIELPAPDPAGLAGLYRGLCRGAADQRQCPHISARNALQVFVVVNGTVVVWNQNVLNGRNVGATVQVTSSTVG
jgi:hypothetical protein